MKKKMFRHLREGKKRLRTSAVSFPATTGVQKKFIFFLLSYIMVQYSIASRAFNKEINVQAASEKKKPSSSGGDLCELHFPWDSDETIQDTTQKNDDDDYYEQ